MQKRQALYLSAWEVELRLKEKQSDDSAGCDLRTLLMPVLKRLIIRLLGAILAATISLLLSLASRRSSARQTTASEW